MDNDSYSIWITITISHSYFITNKCAVSLEPVPNIKALFTNRMLLLKQQDNCTWIVLKQDKQTLFYENLPEGITFNLRADAGFYYYSDSRIPSAKGWKLADVSKNGVWKSLNIAVSEQLLKQQLSVNINIRSAKKYFEFLIIPRSGTQQQVLELREDSGKLTFKQLYVRDFPGEEQSIYVFTTKSKVALQESYNYTIRLFEKKGAGENLLSTSICFPLPGAVSVNYKTNYKDIISSYFYF